MKEEIWKDVLEYEGIYQVSNFSRIKSLPKVLKINGGNQTTSYQFERTYTEKILNPFIAPHGYVMVNLYKDFQRKLHYLHIIVTDAFWGKCPAGLVNDHVNNIRFDCRLENLQRITPRLNTSKDVKNKTSKFTGVSFNSRSKKWTSQIVIRGKNKVLGEFRSETIAAETYQIALNDLLHKAI